MDRIERALYRKWHICKLCKREYGTDYDEDDGCCPLCIERKMGKYSKMDKTRPTTPPKRVWDFKKRGMIW